MATPGSTRRSFLATSSAALAAAALQRPAVAAARPPARSGKQKILVLGGTTFLGPATVEAALAKGHEITLFNRGKTNPGLFPEVEKLHGQRRRPRPDKPNDARNPPQDLKALEGRTWDAVVDTSAYFTGEVEDVCKVLAGHVAQYVFISTLSVYKSLEQDANPVDEQSPLCECADKYTLDLGKNYENYGALKHYCEEAASAAFPGKATLVRPGYIVGPRDPSDRFTCWPARFLRGGECLAPGDQDNDLQFIDVRDLGAWIVHLIEQRIAGTFNATGFDGRISTAEFLHTGKGTLNHQCSFTWVDDGFLEQNGVSAWGEMGCWTPKAKNGHADNQRAIAAGATYRPIAETIRDTAAWVKDGRGTGPWRAGMKAERERELLAKWKAR
ncbi:MAG: NAD-dependent epimerase/dehydratase family protein [Planctomycetes bacterium]|nr:NAD-dependent epimerase/dehydratase family protein [Planctomycetota bacterium]